MFSLERQAPGLPFSFEFQELDLPFIPGRQAREGAGPGLLAYPAQRSQHDHADDHPLMEAGAAQHMTHHAQPDQPSAALPAKREPPGGAAGPLLPAAMLAGAALPVP